MDVFEKAALSEAKKAYKKGEVPVGVIIVNNNGEVLSRAHNLKEKRCDVVAHAEILALQKAIKKQKDWRLDGCTLYSTLEPCPMCAGAIIHARLKKVVYFAPDLKWGAAGTRCNLFESSLFNHNVEIEYRPKHESVHLLKDFFKALRL
jgi:tRNA(adenine34) deaminase